MNKFRNIKDLSREDIKQELADWVYLLEKKQTLSAVQLVNKEIDLSSLKRLNCTMSPNGAIFSCDKQGFLPEMMQDIYNDRVKYKKKMIARHKGSKAVGISWMCFHLEVLKGLLEEGD